MPPLKIMKDLADAGEAASDRQGSADLSDDDIVDIAGDSVFSHMFNDMAGARDHILWHETLYDTSSDNQAVDALRCAVKEGMRDAASTLDQRGTSEDEIDFYEQLGGIAATLTSSLDGVLCLKLEPHGNETVPESLLAGWSYSGTVPDMLILSDAMIARSQILADSLKHSVFTLPMRIERKCRECISIAYGKAFGQLSAEQQSEVNTRVTKLSEPWYDPAWTKLSYMASEFCNPIARAIVTEFHEYRRANSLTYLSFDQERKDQASFVEKLGLHVDSTSRLLEEMSGNTSRLAFTQPASGGFMQSQNQTSSTAMMPPSTWEDAQCRMWVTLMSADKRVRDVLTSGGRVLYLRKVSTDSNVNKSITGIPSTENDWDVRMTGA